MDRRGWLVRDEVWFPRAVVVTTTVVGALCAVTEPTREGAIELAGATVVIVVGMLVALRRPGIWFPVLIGVLFTPAVVMIVRDRNEGFMFVLMLSLMFVMGRAPSLSWRVAAGVLASLLPVSVHLLPDMRIDGWPYWTGGALLTWFSVEQNLRFQAMVTELATTRDRLAEQAVLLERRRIAAEMHDLLGHSLGVILLHVTGARRRVEDDPQAAREALARAEDVGRASLAEMRRTAAALRNPADDPNTPTPGLADLTTLVARTREAGADVALDVEGDVAGVEPMIGLSAYRVVQESLANATRHAPGVPVRVCVRVLPETLEVEVVDAGRGRAPAARLGVGIVGMRERVEALGGNLAAGPTGSGWRVLAHVPRAAPSGARS